MTPPNFPTQHLGDSVYIGVDRGMLTLTTENGSGPSNTIYMETEVVVAFLDYLKRYAPQLMGE